MKWLLIWLLLTGTYLLGLLLSWLFVDDREVTAETLVHLAVIPAVQIVALAVVAYVRRQRPSPPRPSSPTAPPSSGRGGRL